MNWAGWPESKPEEYTPRMIDLQFDLVGTTIPTENAQLLADALLRLLPWLGEEPGCGLQHLKRAETNSGDVALNINRRTKLFIRVPKTRVDDMQGRWPSLRGSTRRWPLISGLGVSETWINYRHRERSNA